MQARPKLKKQAASLRLTTLKRAASSSSLSSSSSGSSSSSSDRLLSPSLHGSERPRSPLAGLTSDSDSEGPRGDGIEVVTPPQDSMVYSPTSLCTPSTESFPSSNPFFLHPGRNDGTMTGQATFGRSASFCSSSSSDGSNSTDLEPDDDAAPCTPPISTLAPPPAGLVAGFAGVPPNAPGAETYFLPAFPFDGPMGGPSRLVRKQSTLSASSSVESSESEDEREEGQVKKGAATGGRMRTLSSSSWSSSDSSDWSHHDQPIFSPSSEPSTASSSDVPSSPDKPCRPPGSSGSTSSYRSNPSETGRAWTDQEDDWIIKTFEAYEAHASRFGSPYDARGLPPGQIVHKVAQACATGVAGQVGKGEKWGRGLKETKARLVVLLKRRLGLGTHSHRHTSSIEATPRARSSGRMADFSPPSSPNKFTSHPSSFDPDATPRTSSSSRFDDGQEVQRTVKSSTAAAGGNVSPGKLIRQGSMDFLPDHPIDLASAQGLGARLHAAEDAVDQGLAATFRQPTHTGRGRQGKDVFGGSLGRTTSDGIVGLAIGVPDFQESGRVVGSQARAALGNYDPTVDGPIKAFAGFGGPLDVDGPATGSKTWPKRPASPFAVPLVPVSGGSVSATRGKRKSTRRRLGDPEVGKLASAFSSATSLVDCYEGPPPTRPVPTSRGGDRMDTGEEEAMPGIRLLPPSIERRPRFSTSTSSPSDAFLDPRYVAAGQKAPQSPTSSRKRPATSSPMTSPLNLALGRDRLEPSATSSPPRRVGSAPVHPTAVTAAAMIGKVFGLDLGTSSGQHGKKGKEATAVPLASPFGQDFVLDGSKSSLAGPTHRVKAPAAVALGDDTGAMGISAGRGRGKRVKRM